MVTRRLLVAVFLLAASPAVALETDQYYAWGRPLTDATDAINAKFNLEISLALAEEARAHPRQAPSCGHVAARIMDRLGFEIFQDVELWTIQSSLVDRVPARAEEVFRYRASNLYANHGPFDFGMWLPSSPTIEIDGVRIGTDKLAHFVSSGWKYRNAYLRHRRVGHGDDEATRRAIRWGILEERSINGSLANGVFSRADMEANYHGMRFYVGLCEGPAAILALEGDAWAQRRRVDFRDYVSPEWDESYQTPIFTPGRWRKVRPVLLGYCGRLADPDVQARLARYRTRDGQTVTEEVIETLVGEGKLRDPAPYTLAANCPATQLPPASAAEMTVRREPVAARADLKTEVIAHDRDRVPRTFTIAGAQLSYPRRVTISLGWLRAEVPREWDCRTICDLRGVFAQVEPGFAGGQLSLGVARVIAETGRGERLLSSVYLAFGIKGALLRTWGDSTLVPPHQTLLGFEGEFTVARVNFSLGVFRHIAGGEPERRWLITGGLGWGF